VAGFYADGRPHTELSDFGSLTSIRARAWYPGGQLADDWSYDQGAATHYGSMDRGIVPFSPPEFLPAEAASWTAAAYAFINQPGSMHPQDGTRTLWYESGGKLAEIQYKAGALEGPSRTFAKNGAVLDQWSFQRGLPADGKRLVLSSAGGPIEELNYRGGQLEGPRRSWTPGAVLIDERHFAQGHLAGEQALWSPQGKPTLWQLRGSGSQLLAQKRFHPDGRLMDSSSIQAKAPPQSDANGLSLSAGLILREEFSPAGHRIRRAWFKAWGDEPQDHLRFVDTWTPIGVDRHWDESGRLSGLEGWDAHSERHDPPGAISYSPTEKNGRAGHSLEQGTYKHGKFSGWREEDGGIRRHYVDDKVIEEIENFMGSSTRHKFYNSSGKLFERKVYGGNGKSLYADLKYRPNGSLGSIHVARPALDLFNYMGGSMGGAYDEDLPEATAQKLGEFLKETQDLKSLDLEYGEDGNLAKASGRLDGELHPLTLRLAGKDWSGEVEFNDLRFLGAALPGTLHHLALQGQGALALLQHPWLKRQAADLRRQGVEAALQQDGSLDWGFDFDGKHHQPNERYVHKAHRVHAVHAKDPNEDEQPAFNSAGGVSMAKATDKPYGPGPHFSLSRMTLPIKWLRCVILDPSNTVIRQMDMAPIAPQSQIFRCRYLLHAGECMQSQRYRIYIEGEDQNGRGLPRLDEGETIKDKAALLKRPSGRIFQGSFIYDASAKNSDLDEPWAKNLMEEDAKNTPK
jgi:antitoxin component YwqK of YwqJK toxin-antitoxin module